MQTPINIPSAAVALLIAGSAAMVGCHDPEFKIRQDRRDQRIRGMISDAERYDGYRRGYIDNLFEADARLNELRAVHLRATIDAFESIEEKRRRNWEDAPPSESIVIQRMIYGQPDQIPSVWARMIY